MLLKKWIGASGLLAIMKDPAISAENKEMMTYIFGAEEDLLERGAGYQLGLYHKNGELRWVTGTLQDLLDYQKKKRMKFALLYSLNNAELYYPKYHDCPECGDWVDSHMKGG